MQIKGYIRLAKQPYIKPQVWRYRVILFCVQLLLECTCFQFLTIRQLPLKHIVITILKHSILGNNSGNNNNYIYSKSLPIEANWTEVFIYYRVLQTSIPGGKMKVDDNIYRYAKSLITTVSSQMKQEMSLKKTNGVELKKTKNYFYINLTQMTENLEWLLSRISGQLFWPTLLESKWCFQIPLRTFITCVMTDRRRKNLQVLSCSQSTCSSQ